MPFLGHRASALGQKNYPVDPHGQLTSLGANYAPLGSNDVTHVQREKFVHPPFT
jgi:hypothetical protein